MKVRRATGDDIEAAVCVQATVAEEGSIGTESPVDFDSLRLRMRQTVALYARSGFAVEGFRRDHYRRRDGSLRSTLLMARSLDVADSAGLDRATW